MARRGYRVTVYEQHPQAGGMLRYGIPNYRLPRALLDAEIDRIARLGVDIRLDTTVGSEISLGELRARHAASMSPSGHSRAGSSASAARLARRS